jgi:hypothetical protein
MLRKDRKMKYKICLLKTTKCKKEKVEGKNRNKEQGQETEKSSDMRDINLYQ